MMTGRRWMGSRRLALLRRQVFSQTNEAVLRLIIGLLDPRSLAAIECTAMLFRGGMVKHVVLDILRALHFTERRRPSECWGQLLAFALGRRRSGQTTNQQRLSSGAKVNSRARVCVATDVATHCGCLLHSIR